MERAVRKALASIDPEHREVIVLRDIEGLTYDEIMQITGLIEGTVKSRLHRARAALREAITRELGTKVPE
jgi:RNA polymerase sigma-70 factor (ECF subfamily)